MNRNLRLKRFDRMSRLLWAGVALVLGVASIVTQLATSETVAADPLNSQRFTSPNASVNYANVYWSLVNARITEPDQEGVITVVADVDVYNSNETGSATFFSEGLVLRSVRSLDQEPEQISPSSVIELDRFANSESTRILRVDNEATQHITLAFKTKRSNFELEDWVIEIRHKDSARPALLPLQGEPVVEIVSYELSPQTQLDSDGASLFSGRASLNPNLEGRRSLEGKSFFFAEISTADLEAATYLADTDAWSLSLDEADYEMVSLDSQPRGEETRYLAVFDINGSMEGSNLIIEEPNGDQIDFVVSETESD